MKLEKFAEEIQNTTNGLMVTEQTNQITVQAFELELSGDLQQVTADVDFMPNLEYQKIDELTLIIKEVD